MRVNRAYVDGTLAVGARVALPEDAAAHLLRVLRLDVGDGCVLFNGDGHDYDARVVAAGKRGGEVEVTGMRAVDIESPLRIVLVQGIARGEKMDWILQKATRSEEHTSELQSLMRISYAVFCLKKKTKTLYNNEH